MNSKTNVCLFYIRLNSLCVDECMINETRNTECKYDYIISSVVFPLGPAMFIGLCIMYVYE